MKRIYLLRQLFLLVIFAGQLSFADYVPVNKWQSVSGFKVGARFASIWESRGIINYNDYQILPVIAVFMFEDRFEFLTSSIGYRDFIYKDQIRFRTRLQAISDNPIFPINQKIADIYPDREDSFEWVNRLEFFLPAYNDEYRAEIDFSIHKDIKAHQGLYYELLGKIKLFTFENYILRQSTVEPNFYFTLGHGDRRHNAYYYGALDSEGFNNLSYGLWFHFKDLADRNNPVLTIKRFEILGEKNKNTHLSKNRNQGVSVTFTYTHDLLN